MTPGRTTYHLRRLRLHGLIERQPHSNRYRVTGEGLRMALFCSRTYNRLLRPGSTVLTLVAPTTNLSALFSKLEPALEQHTLGARLAVA